MVCWTNSIRVKVWFCKVIIKNKASSNALFFMIKANYSMPYFWAMVFISPFLTNSSMPLLSVCGSLVLFLLAKKCSWLCRSRVWFFLLASLFMSDKGLEWYLLVLGYQQNRRIQVFWHNRHWVYRILMCTFRFGKWQWYHIADSRI